jgi:hypothetical protein
MMGRVVAVAPGATLAAARTTGPGLAEDLASAPRTSRRAAFWGLSQRMSRTAMID